MITHNFLQFKSFILILPTARLARYTNNSMILTWVGLELKWHYTPSQHDTTVLRAVMPMPNQPSQQIIYNSHLLIMNLIIPCITSQILINFFFCINTKMILQSHQNSAEITIFIIVLYIWHSYNLIKLIEKVEVIAN